MSLTSPHNEGQPSSVAGISDTGCFQGRANTVAEAKRQGYINRNKAKDAPWGNVLVLVTPTTPSGDDKYWGSDLDHSRAAFVAEYASDPDNERHLTQH